MAISYAAKYEKRVDERFSMKSLSEAFTNTNYNWEGVNTINVYSIPTVAMTDYTASGTNRFGTPSELQNEVQTMLLTKDRSFTYTVDRLNNDDTMGANDADKALVRQVDEVIVPEIDTYVFKKMADAAIANGSVATAAITADNAYEKFLDGQIKLDEALVPEVGRKLAATSTFIKFLRLDPSFTLSSEIGMKSNINGFYGDVDGLPVVKVPSTRLGQNVAFIIAHPVATVMAKKLTMYRVLKEVPGIDGKLAEGRVRYDAFVLDSKVDGIYVHLTAAQS